MRNIPAIKEIDPTIFSLMIFFPQCRDVARKSTQRKQPNKIEKQEKKAEILVAVLACEASTAPNTPVHQTIVIGLEIART